MNHLFRVLLVVTMVTLLFPAGAQCWPRERDGFVIGFNVGFGAGTLRPEVGDVADGGGGAGAFRLGWAFNDQFLVGYEGTAWTGNVDSNADLTLRSNKLNFTWYPASQGWFLRGGFGWGSAELKGQLIGRTFTISESGGAFGFGAGHEWRLTRKFALGVAVDFNSIDLEGSNFDFTNFTAQLNWYF